MGYSSQLGNGIESVLEKINIFIANAKVGHPKSCSI